MRKIALLAFGLLLASPAYAADNTLLVTPCASGCITTKSKDIGAGVQAPQPVISDTGGNPLATPTAGADGASNTSTGLQGYVRPSWWNGVTWDRAPGDVTNGAFVNVKTSVLPTDAATSAAQTTGNGTLASILTAVGLGSLVDEGAFTEASTSVISMGCYFKTSPAALTTGQGGGVACTARRGMFVNIDTVGGAALPKGGVGVVNGGSTYQAVAAGSTATVLQTSTGAIGDYLSHCDLYPTSTSPGVVTVFDNTNAAAGSVILFPGGATSLSNLAPISVPVGAVSTAGAWKVTTGTAISVVCYGKFS